MNKLDWGKAQKIFAINKKVDYPYSREVLFLLAAGVFISASFLMPGLPQALAPFIYKNKKYKTYRLKQTLKRFQKQKVVEVIETTDGQVVRITKNGLTKALKYKLDGMEIKKKKFWDKKWRIVIFDIPENKKGFRDAFRERLRQLGFFALQESVFVHAYPCFDEVEFLRQVYGVDIGVTYIIAEKIEGQDDIFKKFFQ